MVNQLKVQIFRTNDIVDDGGKQFELGKNWCEDFFGIDTSLPNYTINLKFKSISREFNHLNDKIIELKLADVSNRGDRKAYSNSDSGRSQIKDFFIDDLRLNEVNIKRDYFAILLTQNEYFLYFVPKELYDNFLKLFSSTSTTVSVEPTPHETKKESTTQQIIYYGAPGTGKSFKVENREGESEDDRIRTTFHPDTDYSSFVGCYKPVPKEDDPDKITYKFIGQCFTKAYIEAWKRYVAPQEGQSRNFTLVIEEINRGNCAQIFGDIFQLLDRDGDGFSQYTISPDVDLTNFLAEQFDEVKKQMVEQGFEKIADGIEMKLPPNLSIIATMNTSDQSLFPIDSAFKRRWDWEYIPISYEPKDKDLTPIKNKIDINGTIYDWGAFIKEVNERILKLTHSEDKQLGYFFVKPVNGNVISMQRFVSKVIFYLWSDIYKDYAGRNDSIFKVNGEDISFNKFFVDGVIDDDLVNKFIQQLGIEPYNIDEVSIESPKPYFRVNNRHCNSSAQLAATIVKEFVSLNSNLSADEVIQQWSVIDVPNNKSFISKTQGGGKWDRIDCANGTFLYVSRENWYFNTGKNEANVIALINQVNEKKNWRIKVEIIQS